MWGFLLPDARSLSGSCCAGAVTDVICGGDGVQLYPLPDCCRQGDRIRLSDTGQDTCLYSRHTIGTPDILVRAAPRHPDTLTAAQIYSLFSESPVTRTRTGSTPETSLSSDLHLPHLSQNLVLHDFYFNSVSYG